MFVHFLEVNMELIYRDKLIKEKLIELIKDKDTDEIYISVAWATMNNAVSKELKKYKYKINTLLVGISDEITSPSFLEEFKNKIQVVINLEKLNGIFHSKIYLFTNKDKSVWKLLIGSANLTNRAMETNEETMILIDNISNDSFNINDIDKLLEHHLSFSMKIDDNFINEYKYKYKKNNEIENNLSYNLYNEEKLINFSWEKYEYYIKKRKIDGNYLYLERLKLLDIAKSFFERGLSNISLNELSCLLGISKYLNSNININWYNFGHMRTSYQNIISEISKESILIENIPFNGEINKNIYKNYMNKILNIKGVDISIASRLLALKRPDFFFCVTGGNELNLKKEFGVSKKQVSKQSSVDVDKVADSYWELIKRIHESSWNRNGNKDSNIWNSRIAMLDTILFNYQKSYYEILT